MRHWRFCFPHLASFARSIELSRRTALQLSGTWHAKSLPRTAHRIERSRWSCSNRGASTNRCSAQSQNQEPFGAPPIEFAKTYAPHEGLLDAALATWRARMRLKEPLLANSVLSSCICCFLPIRRRTMRDAYVDHKPPPKMPFAANSKYRNAAQKLATFWRFFFFIISFHFLIPLKHFRIGLLYNDKQ